MTAKKKRKKLVECLSCEGQGLIVRDWARRCRGAFDAGPVQCDQPPGDISATLTSSTASATNNKQNDSCEYVRGRTSTISSTGTFDGEDEYWVTEEDCNDGMRQFVDQLFGQGNRGPLVDLSDSMNIESNEDIKCLKFVSRVGGTCKDRRITWNLVRWKNDILFVQIDSAAFPEGSRGSFVQLLEYAEEELMCEKVFVCFPTDHAHREVIVKTFMFLGFVPTRPDHKDLPRPQTEGSRLSFMGYIIE